MSYGVPFKGSKNRIADKILDVLPSASTLYDVFAGGCAISHCALLSGKYQKVTAIDEDNIPTLFEDAWNGKQFSTDWVTRDEYFDRYKSDPFVRSVWSFGNKPGHYIYGQSLMEFKHALHNAAVNGDFTLLRELHPDICDEVADAVANLPLSAIWIRRLTIGTIVGKKLGSRRSAAVENLERLSRLQSIYSSRALAKAQFNAVQCDYRDIGFLDPNGIIYCDPPYHGTDGYAARNADDHFDKEAFYDWCERQTLPVFISEYTLPDDRFKCVAAFDKTSTICATKTTAVIERLYRPRCQL